MAGVLAAPALSGPGGSGQAAARPPAVLVLVPDLAWSGAPPVLDGWAKASLSVRSARARGGAADGYLTVGKAARSAAPGGGLGPVAPAGDGGARLVDWGRLQAYDRSLHYGGTLGSLGQALAAAGRPRALVADDPAALAAAADHGGAVPRVLPGGPAGVRLALAGGAEAVVVAAPAADLTSVVDAAGPVCVVVASVSSPASDRHLGVMATSPACGLGRAGLSSPATRQAHLATLADVAPTFLSRLGVAPPAGAGGSVVRPSGPVTVAAVVARDRRTVTADRDRTPLVLLFVAMTAVGALVAMRWPRARPAAAWPLLAVPPASFLVMLVPWWRWGLAGALVVGGAMVAALAAAAAALARRRPALGVGALAGLAAAVVGVDAAFGGRLEIDAPFGNSPVVAGRFYGVGNIGSGFLLAGLVVAVALAWERWERRAVPACAVALGAGLVVGGAPSFGADVGGALAAVPTYGTLALAAYRRRPSARWVLAVAGATVLLLAAFAAVDLSRPAAARTHLGQVLSGGDLGGEIVRKAQRALATVVNPLSLVAVLGLAGLAGARVRLSHRPALSAMALALAVAAAVGSAVNDSGLLVASSVVAVGWPALLLLAGEAGTVDGTGAVDSTGAVDVTGAVRR
ncbi:MAG: hypothetical protein ABR511_12260 [Acidimicrobiales bacterium]